MTTKVLVLTTRLNVGGVSRLIINQINQSRNNGIEYVLVTGRCENNEIEDWKVGSIKCKLIRVNSLSRSINIYSDLKTLILLILLFRKLKPDFVHTHMFKAGLLGRIANLLCLLKLKSIHTYHGELSEGYFGKVKSNTYLQVEKYLGKFTNILVAVSSATKHELFVNGVGKKQQWRVINPGIEINTRRIYRNKVYKHKTVIWIGRFEKIKDPELAIEVIKKLREIYPFSLRILMVGDGSERTLIENLNKEHRLGIKVTGWVRSVKSLIADSNVLFMTSKNEGFGLVALEAAILGVPTVSTDTGGIKDFIINGKSGYIVSKNPGLIAKRISTLLKDNRKSKLIGEEARKRAVREFSIESYIKKVENLYQAKE